MAPARRTDIPKRPRDGEGAARADRDGAVGRATYERGNDLSTGREQARRGGTFSGGFCSAFAKISREKRQTQLTQVIADVGCRTPTCQTPTRSRVPIDCDIRAG